VPVGDMRNGIAKFCKMDVLGLANYSSVVFNRGE
jgi:hypothetical protein